MSHATHTLPGPAGQSVPSQLADAALSYGGRGFAVFPIEPQGKRPIGQLARNGFKDATADLARIRQWWCAEPMANIGLETGRTFDVLDVDGPRGLEALDQACGDRESVDGPTCRTGGGGFHVYLAPTGLGNKVGVLPKVDWRGRGGYVVAPPSLHATGNQYEWLEHWSLEEQCVAPVPPWLRRLLEPESLILAVSARPPGRNRREPYVYATAVLEREIGRVALAAHGERNDMLNRAAHAVGRVLVAGKLDFATAVGALETAGLRAGLESGEVRATVRSGLEAGLRPPRSIS